MSSTNAIISQVTSTPISSCSQPQYVPQMRGIKFLFSIKLYPIKFWPTPILNWSFFVFQSDLFQKKKNNHSILKNEIILIFIENPKFSMFFFFIFFSHFFIFQQLAVNSVSHTMSPNVITTSEKKKVFVTGSGNIEVTQVSQPISHPPNIVQNVTPNITTNVSFLPPAERLLNDNNQWEMVLFLVSKKFITLTQS